VKPDTCVALLFDRSIDLVIAELAILKCGAAYVPIDSNAPLERQKFMLEDCQVRFALSTQGQTLPELPKLRRIDIDELQLGQEISENLGLSGESEAVAYVMYTSGSTGQPKGVIVPHRAISRLVFNNGYAEFAASDRVAFAANPAFDASTMEVWGPLLHGGCTVIVDRDAFLDATRFAQVLERERVTVLFMTTALFNEYAFAIPHALTRLRVLLCGGERNDPAAFAQLLRGEMRPEHLIHCYGPTETTTFAITHEVTEVAEGTASIPIGRPIGNTRVYILDAQGEPVPVGVAGELHIGGVQIARGYLNRPELTAERFVLSPFVAGDRLYKTGDLARYLPDGTIEFLGRNDFQVKLRGFRIELGEIEAQLAQYPGIRDVVVLARKFRQQCMRLYDTLPYSDSGNANAHRQCINEQSQCTIRTFTALHPAKQHRAEYHVITAGKSPQNSRPRYMENTRRTHSQYPRTRAQSPTQCRVDTATIPHYTRAVALHIG